MSPSTKNFELLNSDHNLESYSLYEFILNISNYISNFESIKLIIFVINIIILQILTD